MLPSPDPFTAALQALRSGQLAQAEQLYRQLVQAHPQHAGCWHLLGVVATHRGRPQEALDYIGRAIALQPDAAAFHLNYGVALRMVGRRADAMAHFREAVRLQPDLAHAHNNLANALHESGDRSQSLVHWQRALELQPDNVDARCNLAQVLTDENRFDEAMEHARQAVDRLPHHASAHKALGSVHAGRKEWSQAESCYRKALRERPEWPELHYDLAHVLQMQNHLPEAAAHLRQALQLNPNYAPAHNKFGIVRGLEGQPVEAILHFEQALRLRPDYAEAHHNLAVVLKMQRRFEDAVAHLKEVLRLFPDAIEPASLLAGTLDQMGRTDEAIGVLRAALDRQPAEAGLHAGLGTALANAGQRAEAVRHFREAIRLKPDQPVLHSCLLDSLNYDPDLSPEELFAEHCRWNALHAQVAVLGPHPNHDRTIQRRLRVGYLSGDLIRHIAAHFIEPIITHHDKEQVEVFCYADVAAPDARTTRFWAMVDHWQMLCGKTDAEVARLIREDRIDILVDLGGHTGSRLGVFARRPAPVQVTYLGYPNTTGLSTIDYRLTDAIADPLGEPICHSEELVRLPGGFCCYAPPVDVPEPGPLPAQTAGLLTFGSLHKLVKLNDPVLDLWCEVLRAVPTARLLLFRNNLSGSVREELRRRFHHRGVEDGRLVFPDPTVPGSNFLLVYQAVDIALDTFPWTGHATACEGLWMGVPILTLSGNRHASRMVASVLTQVGLEDWITRTPQEFIARAVSWSGRIEELAALRAGMRERIRHSALCDGKGFTRKLETAYRQMWRRGTETTPTASSVSSAD